MKIENAIVGAIIKNVDGKKGRIQSVIDDKTIDVMWNDLDGEELDVEEVELITESSAQLELEFKELYDKHINEIHVQLEIANEALNKAEELSEKYGIPFEANVSPLYQPYVPNSFEEKFAVLDPDYIEKVTNMYVTSEYSGWKHSAVCY